MSYDYDFLDVTFEQGLLTLCLNRPELLNASNLKMESELCHFFTEVSHDQDVLAVVITGKGKAFCGGGDFEYIREGIEQPEKFFQGMTYGKRLVFAMLDCSKPVVAKINGPAVGLGASIALLCDVSFAAKSAIISDPHVAIGLVAGDGGAVIWPQLIGYNRAKQFLFTGDPIPAAKAAEIGLINEVVDDEALDAAVTAYAHKLMAMPPYALRWTKASINIGLKQIAHSVMDASMAYEGLSNMTEEHQQAFSKMEAKLGKA